MYKPFRFANDVFSHIPPLLRLTAYANGRTSEFWSSQRGVYGHARNAIATIIAEELTRLNLPNVAEAAMDIVADRFPVESVFDLQDIVNEAIERDADNAPNKTDWE